MLCSSCCVFEGLELCPSKDCISFIMLAISDVAVEVTAQFLITSKLTSLVCLLSFSFVYSDSMFTLRNYRICSIHS